MCEKLKKTVPTLLSINNYFYRRGGSDFVFLEQNRLFQDRGWKVIPFAMNHKKNNATEWQSFFVEEIEFGQNYSFVQKISNTFKVIYSFEAQKKITQLVDEIQPDIAHAHNVYHHISPAIFNTLKAKGIPTVLTLHDLKIACPAYKMMTHDGICERCKNGNLLHVVKNKCIKNSTVLSTVVMLETIVQRMMKTYTKGVDQFIVPSKFYLEKLVEWGWPREKFTYIPNFVDVLSMNAKGMPGDAFVFFGRLSEEKGIKTLILACQKAKTKLNIVGTGPLEEELQKLISSSEGRIKLLGYQTGEDLFDIIRDARAVVLPSEWYENAPISIMEAYALERPVIGANIGGIPEMVKDNETGTLFESGDVEALSQVLMQYDEMSPEELLKMGRAGRQWVENDFTVEYYIDRVQALYRTLGVDC